MTTTETFWVVVRLDKTGQRSYLHDTGRSLQGWSSQRFGCAEYTSKRDAYLARWNRDSVSCRTRVVRVTRTRTVKS